MNDVGPALWIILVVALLIVVFIPGTFKID